MAERLGFLPATSGVTGPSFIMTCIYVIRAIKYRRHINEPIQVERNWVPYVWAFISMNDAQVQVPFKRQQLYNNEDLFKLRKH